MNLFKPTHPSDYSSFGFVGLSKLIRKMHDIYNTYIWIKYNIYFIYIPNEVCSCEIPIDVGMRGLIGSGTLITHCDKKKS